LAYNNNSCWFFKNAVRPDGARRASRGMRTDLIFEMKTSGASWSRRIILYFKSMPSFVWEPR